MHHSLVINNINYVQPKKPIEKRENEMGDGETIFDGDLRPIPFRKIMADMERCLIEQAMKNMRGNQVRAALQLGISRSTLIKRLREYAKQAREADPK